MKKLLFFLFVLPCILFSQQIDFETHGSFIKIYISHLSKAFELNEINKIPYLKLSKIKWSVPKNNSDIIEDCLNFIFVMDSDIKYELNYNIIKQRNLSDIVNNDKNILNNLKHEFKLSKIGFTRNVLLGSLLIQPFNFNDQTKELSVIDEVEIIIKIGKKLNVSDFNLNDPDFPFFSEVINLNHLNNFLNKKVVKIHKDIVQNEDWYNKDVHYVKLETKYDGIAKADCGSILNEDNSFNGKTLKYFHLLFKGEEQPITFYNDSDGKFDNDDQLFFIGHRSEGDTTWLNYYSDQSAFFLYYDERSEGLRFKDFPFVSSQIVKEIYAGTNQHIEYESNYFWGLDPSLQWDIENIPRERWLWKVIDSETNKNFDYYFPLSEINDTLELGINIISTNFIKYVTPKHYLALIINNDTIQRFSIDSGSVNYLKFKIPSEKLIFGYNKLSIKQYRQYNQDSTLIIPDKVGIDYITLNYQGRAVSDIKTRQIYLNDLQNDTGLEISNFKNKEIFILDKSLNYFKHETGEEGVDIAIGTIINPSKYSSLRINDSCFNSDKAGLHIVTYNLISGIYNYKIFASFDNSIKDFINSVTNENLICVSYNLDKEIPQNIKDIFISLGSQFVNALNSNQSWVFSCIKGDLDAVYETPPSIGSSKLTKFIITANGNSFSKTIGFSKENNYNLLVSDSKQLENAKISSVSSTDYMNLENIADEIIISHPEFRSGVDSLAEYRRSQGYKIFVADINEIYKEFNYGIKSAHAIKSFLKYAYNNWQKPAPLYVLLVGDANWDSRNIHYEGSENIDFVPTYGWPASDYWYSCLDSGKDIIHDMYIGRIPSNTKEEFDNVFNKIKEYESAPRRPWMKRIIALTGGQDGNEMESFRDNMNDLLDYTWQNEGFEGDTLIVNKQKSSLTSPAQANEIIDKINSGGIWLIFAGHGSPQHLDLDGWNARYLNNKGNYSFFTSVSCNTAAFAEPMGISRNEEYVVIKDKGFIASGGSTNLGLTTAGNFLLNNMLSIVTDTLQRIRSFGEIIHNAKIPLFWGDDKQFIAFSQQYTLLGDPMENIRIPKNPELYILDEDVKISNYFENKIIIENDSVVKISGMIYNNGPCENKEVKLKLIHRFNSLTDTLITKYPGLCTKEIFRFDSLLVFNKLGKHYVDIFVETADTLFIAYSNNFNVLSSGLLALDPLPFWNTDSENLKFRFINPQLKPNKSYEFSIFNIDENGNESLILNAAKDDIKVYENFIEWNTANELSNNKNYFLYGRIIDTISQSNSDWLRIPFNTQKLKARKVNAAISGDQFSNCDLSNLELSYNGNNSTLKFKDDNFPFYIYSSRGYVDPDTSIDRWVTITYDSIIYIYTAGAGAAPVGINLIVVSGETGKFITKRFFNTWDGVNASSDLIKFLKDTIKDDDWLLLASCGASWRMFDEVTKIDSNAIGGFKSLKETLSEYGSEKVWLLPYAANNSRVSFAFAGRKGSKTEDILEEISIKGLPVEITNQINVKYKEADLSTPYIGVSQVWDSLNLSFEGNVSTTLSLLGLNQIDSTILLKTYNNIKTINLNQILAEDYPNLKLNLHLKNEDENVDFNLNSINFHFTPASELAFSKQKSGLEKSGLIKGDTAIYHFVIENLSLRNQSGNSILAFNVLSKSGKEIGGTDTLQSLGIDTSLMSKEVFESSILDNTNNLFGFLNEERMINEIYYFNNQINSELNFNNDTIKPWVIIKMDGVIIKDKDYVAFRPFVNIDLFDNSYIPIEGNPLGVLINLRKQDSLKTENYKLNIINSGNHKAQLSFLPDSLYEGINHFEVFFNDPSGNIDTVTYELYTIINSFIFDQINYPNPFSGGTTLKFVYKAPDNNGNANINIFDINGRRIKSFKQAVNIGENLINWDGLDENGNTIPSGTYVFIISILSENFSDPVNGVMMKSN